MVPSGPPTSVGGGQSVSPSILRSNSGVIAGGQAVSVPSQPPFSSLVSPRNQFNNNNNNMGLLGNMPNVTSLLSQSLVNGGSLSAMGLPNASVNLQQRGGGGAVEMVGSAEPDPLSSFTPSAQPQGQPFQSPANQMGMDGLQSQQRTEAMQNFQQQFSLPHNQQQQHRGGLGNMAAVKLEPQMGTSDQSVPPQQMQSLRNLSAVKLEPQMQSMGNLGPVKMETQQSDPALFIQQQQQQQQQQQHQQHQQQQQQHQQQLLQLSRQSSHAAAQMNILQQQRIIQMQQQQQQHQILKSLPQQRLQQQQQLQQQALSFRPQVKPSAYEPGMCARRLTHYMFHQKHRPSDNNIEFWRKFVAEYFAPHAKKRWCVSLYGSGRQTTGVFPQDVWHCEICNRKPGRGFETTVEVLPRLYKIKYDSGTLEELLYVDMPREYQNASGQIVLDYAKAIQESVFEQLRVVRDGQLRIVFSSDLKICSWEFCARRHEELIPRRLIIPQVSHLGQVAQKYQAATQNGSSSLSSQELQNSCNLFVASARQLAKALEVPLVNDLGYTKRYVRCLQIAEVVNSMKDLIDYSRETGNGPMESLANFPRKTSNSSGLPAQPAAQAEEQTVAQSSNHEDQNSARAAAAVQLASRNNGVMSVNNSLNVSSSTTSATAIAGLQNTMNPRQENTMSSVNSPYGCGNTVQIPSASSSNSLSQSQANPTSPFPSPTPASNNNAPQSSHVATHLNSNLPVSMSTMPQPASQTTETDPNGSQNSMQQILQEMLSSQLTTVGSLGNDMKGINGIAPGLHGGNGLVGNGIASNAGIGGAGFGNMGGVGPATASGIRAAMNNAMGLNGRVGMNSVAQDPTTMNHQQQDLGNRLMSGGLGAVNNFNNLQFDWKTSP